MVVNEGQAVTSLFTKFKYVVAINDNQRQSVPGENMSYTQYNSVRRRHISADGRYRQCEAVIDVVCDNGARWIKVKASNPYAMQMQFLSCGSSAKVKNVVTMADSCLTAAQQHPCCFKRPRMEMVFSQGITADLAHVLEAKGVIVRGILLFND